MIYVLISREFDMTSYVANSDGKAVAKIGDASFVAVYDDKFVNESEARKYIDAFDGSSAEAYAKNDRVVILPTDVWKKLHEMILANYDMTEK